MFLGDGMGDTGIGALLVRLRTARGLSQQRVADEYNAMEGRSAKTGKEIGRYEREARLPVPYARKHLARVFNVDVAQLDQAVAASKGRRDGPIAGAVEIALPALSPQASRVRGAPLLEDAARSAEFARFIAQRNVDELVVEQLEADVGRLARTYVSHPLMEQYVEIKRLRDGVFELLARTSTPPADHRPLSLSLSSLRPVRSRLPGPRRLRLGCHPRPYRTGLCRGGRT
ncbi:hypothetical protein ABZ723_03440 [Streptomyces sp. NPDC006700]|uniref:helix-turn-helix domain-containing protein n=1 Tax=Streptomyces sp. NPDC006700 TaxID=3154479 RepID=UPI00340CE78A